MCILWLINQSNKSEPFDGQSSALSNSEVFSNWRQERLLRPRWRPSDRTHISAPAGTGRSAMVLDYYSARDASLSLQQGTREEAMADFKARGWWTLIKETDECIERYEDRDCRYPSVAHIKSRRACPRPGVLNKPNVFHVRLTVRFIGRLCRHH